MALLADIRKQTEERDEEIEAQVYDRALRKNLLLKQLDVAVRKGDVRAVTKVARRVCAMHAWKWGFTEEEYLQSCAR
jgi:hypothetical protein